jgi:2-polyprenyl-6-methoxyphenol hydroxylase-like FAD-dependent oxidoreductase
MTEHAVVIVGGGPTGMMLAGELALAGVDVAIVEPRSRFSISAELRPPTIRSASRMRGRGVHRPVYRFPFVFFSRGVELVDPAPSP